MENSTSSDCPKCAVLIKGTSWTSPYQSLSVPTSTQYSKKSYVTCRRIALTFYLLLLLFYAHRGPCRWALSIMADEIEERIAAAVALVENVSEGDC
jgi:hypothetical protein